MNHLLVLCLVLQCTDLILESMIPSAKNDRVVNRSSFLVTLLKTCFIFKPTYLFVFHKELHLNEIKQSVGCK